MNAFSMNKTHARLVLQNGEVFHGKSFGQPISSAGEVVFNTAMTGYPESLTDPSYKGQILITTYPMIGNYGVPSNIGELGIANRLESGNIQISGLVISDREQGYSHWDASFGLGEWLANEGVPGIYGVDTRALTQLIREDGSMLGKIIVDDKDTPWYDPNILNLVEQVSTKEKIVYGKGAIKIMLVDCGVKFNIIRNLLKYDTTVIRVPYDYNFLEEEYDGLFITNGPGDPARCTKTIAHLKQAIQRDIPIFGICLGSQLLALAAGAKTYKLKYGHRSHNQPVILSGTNCCFVSSQNHGFAVDSTGLPPEWRSFFENLNDQTCEGIIHKAKPFFATQFHPEASGGPTDTTFLFGRFIDNISKYKHL